MSERKDNAEPAEDIELEDLDNAGDELGYTDVDWEALREGDADEHDRVIESSADDLRGSVDELSSDLALWAAAQVFADEEDEESFVAVVSRLIDGDWSHPAVDYMEIAQEHFVDACMVEALDTAAHTLKVIEKHAEKDDLMPLRLRALYTHVSGDEEGSLELYQEIVDKNEDDVDLLTFVAEDLALLDHLDRGYEVLEQAEELARFAHDNEAVEHVLACRDEITQSFEV